MLRSLFLVPFFAFTAAAADWPQFRGPDGDGHAAVKNLPVTWNSTTNVAWRVKIPGAGWSSPALYKGHIYLTTAVVTAGDEASPKADRSLRALCLNASTGHVDWDREVFTQYGATAPDSIHRKNGHASPTPLVEDGKVYIHFGHQGTACLDLEGKKIWENRKLFFQPQHGNGGSPVLADGNLIFNCDGREEQYIAALKASNGDVAWKFKRPTEAKSKFAFATPTVITAGGKKQLISPGADVVNALDPATGKELWRATYEGYSIVPKPVFGDGLVYVSSAFDTPEVLAIDPVGEGDITKTNVKWVESKYAPKTPSMIFDNGLLYLVTDSGIVACREAKSGTLLWQSDRVLRDCSASPVLSEGKLYVMDEFGKCAILAAGREYKLIGVNQLSDERTLSSMAVDDGTIYIRGEKDLYCIKNR
ncbi:MAG TPA: PQQ-binding-like beta-propeller repeat protein [Verrucomicrobiales bacterium]|nr:PQQ-binding-like beta-propeller repeat protein [Verrucomicrobiales bacterium]